MSRYEYSTRKLMAKIIEELQFEDMLLIEKYGDEFILKLSNNTYFFKASVSAWKQLWINSESIKKNEGEKLSVLDFIMELNEILGMDDQTLAQFIEEANQTLYADLKLAEFKNYFNIDQLLEISFSRREQLLDGHPKLLLNKGRIGWGVSQLENFSPEYGGQFKLVWLAVKDDLLLEGSDSTFSYQSFLSYHSTNEYQEGYTVVPVHPWQWDRYIRIQFMALIEAGDIVFLGEKGQYFTPQASIRTLSCGSDHDVKLSLSILNTSCVRGIPQKYIEAGADISNKIFDICASDSRLNSVRVLRELKSFSVLHPQFQKLDSCSYRYKELFGGVIRESVESQIDEDEIAMSCASLLIEINGESFIEKIFSEAHCTVNDWLQAYTINVIFPLFHLQTEHGLGLVAHGQNIIVVLTDCIPTGVILKDFQGDLRLSTESPHRNCSAFSTLAILPKEHLIHDLYTGHFISFVRYFSRLLEERGVMKEKDFYLIINRTLSELCGEDNILLSPEFDRILVNKVRFNIGYSETADRPLPMLGQKLQNPIYTEGLR